MKATKTVAATALFALAGCAEHVAVDEGVELKFLEAKQNAQMTVGGRTVYIEKGEGYPSVQLEDGRRVVILDRYTSNDPFLLFANLTQTSGSVLDANGCTTQEYVSVGTSGVTIEESALAGRITPGICFVL
ncbi:hypothetical protein [Roseovarius sp. E0-M6]|uniref:hypothetical protein n=1 Tax=Roseovarius sp. E0-M6 TaxID=3127118 RepID=UPI00300FB9C6